MQKRLQSSAALGVRVGFKLFRHQSSYHSGDEMMLIGKSGDGQAMHFGPFGQAGPIDVRGDVSLADLGEG